MTDKLSSLACLAGLARVPGSAEDRSEAMRVFYDEAAGNALVINKWFAIQAMADYPGVLGETAGQYDLPLYMWCKIVP